MVRGSDGAHRTGRIKLDCPCRSRRATALTTRTGILIFRPGSTASRTATRPTGCRDQRSNMRGVNPKTQEADWPRNEEAGETGDRSEGRSGQHEQGYAHQGILLVGLTGKAEQMQTGSRTAQSKRCRRPGARVRTDTREVRHVTRRMFTDCTGWVSWDSFYQTAGTIPAQEPGCVRLEPRRCSLL
jgi:hypothetical protein